MSRYRAHTSYKSAKSQWLDTLPTSWDRAPLKYIVETRITDGPHETPEFVDEGVPFLSAEAIKFNKLDFEKKRGYITPELHALYSKKCLPRYGDVFMVKSGNTTGAIGIVETNDEFNIWSPLALIRASKDWCLPRYVFYSMLADFFKTSVELSWSQGTQPNIGMGVIENLHIPLPSINEQTCIVHFLDHETAKIDALIEKQQRLIELLKEKRQAVISHAVTKGLNPNAPMKDSGVEWLGEVPAHWTMTKFHYEIDLLEGPGILANDFHDEGVPLLRIQNVKDEFVSSDYKTYLSASKVRAKWDHFRVAKGDLIISCSATTGLVSEVAEDTVGAVPYTGLIRLRPQVKASITKEFIRCLVQSDLFFEQIKLLQSGSTIQHFGPYHLQQMHITLPTVTEQDQIAKTVKEKTARLDSLISIADQQIELMQERRTALISAAVTGKIDVRDWQAAA